MAQVFQNFKKNILTDFLMLGIAEEHAVTFAAGLAASGYKPVVQFIHPFYQESL